MDLAQVLADAGPSLLLAMTVLALIAGKLRLPREVVDAKERAQEYRLQAEKWEKVALESMDLGQRAARIAQGREV